MSLVVVATMTPQPGKLQDLTDAFERVATAIQAEPGCELYAIHSDGNVVVTIERWESQAALDTHMTAPSVVTLLEQGPKFLAKAPEIVPMQALGFGDPVKGMI
ncbi:MAG: putative quinol monooxygenase [Actinomycetota bacterium]